MNVVEATASYESWLRRRLSVVLEEDLALKPSGWPGIASRFLRATYYLWLARLTEHAWRDLADAPAVVGVGDLHVENFGCWRDSEGRLAWGVNDFDEIAALPYTFDLLRLSASALLAVREGHLPLGEKDVSSVVLAGYRDSLQSGGKPFVAGAGHRWLAVLHGATADFWPRLARLPALDGPSLTNAAQEALEALAPTGAWRPTLHRRTAGLGSLGHRRVAAVGDATGGPAARELKELYRRLPASGWAGRT